MLISPTRRTKKRQRNNNKRYNGTKVIKSKEKFGLRGNLTPSKFTPQTAAQLDALESFNEGFHLGLCGFAGTGKTYTALHISFQSIMAGSYDKVVIVRSLAQTRDVGFLPGDVKEKAEEFEAPYRGICSEIFGRDDAYTIAVKERNLQFVTTSFLRGITINNAVVVVDEPQNMTFRELDTVITRIGQNCRIIFAGDVHQDDITDEKKREYSGFRDFLKIIETVDMFEFIDFTVDDIIRSGLVKSYIIAKHKLGMG